MVFFSFPIVIISTKTQMMATNTEFVKPLQPIGCDYGIPSLKPTTSKSRRIAENTAANKAP